MIRSQSEFIDKMYEIVGIERKSYSPVQWDKELGKYEPGNMYPQYFFDSYPPFTKEKQYDLMSVYYNYVNLSIQYETDYGVDGYVVKFAELTVLGSDLPEALAKLVIETYPKFKYDLQEQIKSILEL